MLAPFGQKPYLCRSMLRLCTPSTRKSKGATSSPSFSMYGSKRPPMHASTCIQRFLSVASDASSLIGSITPCAYDGAEPTSMIVRSVIAARADSTSARYVSGSTSNVTISTAR